MRSGSPFILIQSFSGARGEETALSYHAAERKDALRWEDFLWDEREIVIRAEVAKTGKYRRIPLFDVLAEHLAHWRDTGARGRVVTGSLDRFRERMKRELGRARMAEAANYAGVSAEEFARLPESERSAHLKRCVITQAIVSNWTNQLRHSYGTYRMAQSGRNKFAVASEMGNSPSMVEKHYDNRVPRAMGDVWFSLYPERPSNVVQLHLALVKPPAKPVTKRDKKQPPSCANLPSQNA
jgi:integrase